MIKLFYSILAISLLFIAGCGKEDKYSDIRETISEISDCYEDAIRDLQNASKGKDVAKALNSFTKRVAPLMQKAKDLESKYPEFRFSETGKAPKEIKSEIKRYRRITEKFISPDTMKKVMKYSQDPNVIKAQKYMIDTIGM